MAITASASDASLPLAGTQHTFALCQVIRRASPGEIAREVLPADTLSADAAALEPLLARLGAQRPPFAGLTLDRPQVMGVINVTPDSFSDGGERFDPGKAIEDGLAMAEAGASILDVGGESTRPGAASVPIEEELRRVLPTVRGLARQGLRVSIDSRRAQVMEAALEAGAQIINDVTALAGDPQSLALAARSGAAVILMHMQGEPQTMQANPHYDDAALDIYDWLAARIAACEAAGIPRARLALDPGIGFGKTLAHNLQILEQIALFHGLGCPLMLGVSRKSFIGKISRAEPPKARMPGSIAALLVGLERAVQLFRVHDVAETVQAIEVWQAIATAESQEETAAAGG